MRSGNPFGTCAFCGKQIMWIRTKSGKNMPVNPKFVNFIEVNGGREKIVTQDGRVVSGEMSVLGEAGDVGYISHFATCTNRHR